MAGIERQALRDAVVRYNAERLDGLRDRPKAGRTPTLTEAEQVVLLNAVFRRPDRAEDGGSDCTLPMLCRWIERRFDKQLHPASLSRVLRRLDLSRQKARLLHPIGNEKAKAAFAKKGLRDALTAVSEANPGKRIELWFMDDARVGQKGRAEFRWWVRCERPRGLYDRRFERAYLSGAVRPATGADFALVLPEVSAGAMQAFLDHFAAALAENANAVLVLDRAGWHGSRSLVVPPDITLVPLPPHAPKLNAIERAWLFLRECFLSHRLLKRYDDIVNACCEA